MACKTSFELHHHFPRLAEESGFTFNTHRPRIHIDWNKIRLIDIDGLIRDRKFVLIEQHLNDILDCVFESEFDVRILDEGVMKMFRLAQLAVEYQQFCRHYLDRSVYVMKEEITALAQELGTCKKELREKDEELRKLRKRTKHSYKNPLHYGNDNIATMILKTLTHKTDLLPSTSNDNLQYNKCNYCDKVFLNQLYLKSHISRRHPNIMETSHYMETSQKDKHENDSNNENTKLSVEITELRNKLKEMEVAIANASNQAQQTNETANKATQNKVNNSAQEIEGSKKEMKDTGVSTNNDDYLMNKIEEWKKEEHENYNKEINKLRNQIMETINTLKEKDCQKPVANESIMIEQLHATIKQQGLEIIALQQELSNARVKAEKDNADRNREAKTQTTFWAKQAEDQAKQYESLLQKLNEVAKDAKESRALAESETQRAAQLQTLLQQHLNNKMLANDAGTDNALIPNHKPQPSNNKTKSVKNRQFKKRANEVSNNKTLEMLQRKAQELLSIGSGSISSTSSDVSSADKVKPFEINTINIKDKQTNEANALVTSNDKEKINHVQNSKKRDTPSFLHKNEAKKEKLKARPKKIEQLSTSALPGSPVKVVRAKITEEVNNRLVSAGVDPLKSRLPQSVFQKKRTQLQQQNELKTKKNPAHEKVRHAILAYLDSSATSINKDVIHAHEYVSPSKVMGKPFHNLTSMISNVKTKALSLVKLNDTNTKNKQKSLDTGVAKRALFLLKTPPGSASNSPVTIRQSPLKTNTSSTHNSNTANVKTKFNQDIPNVSNKVKNNLISSPKINEVMNYDTDDESEESEHKYYNSTAKTTKSIENLIKSPARRPSSATTDYGLKVHKYMVGNDNLLRTQSATNIAERNLETNIINKISNAKISGNSSDDVESVSEAPVKKPLIEDNAPNIVKQTKSVLKNASSTSSLNKKKVLFDMDAIQMKSVSASPSQSITEKSDGNEKYELGLVNLDGEEWDISSIDNEPLKNDTKIQNVTRTSPKIAELKEKIESQLARRNETPTIALAGKVDVLGGAMVKASSIGGSNTSLGSSILDDSECAPVVNHKTFVKSKKIIVKDDSDIDISEFSIDGIANKNESF